MSMRFVYLCALTHVPLPVAIISVTAPEQGTLESDSSTPVMRCADDLTKVHWWHPMALMKGQST